jgi:Mg-chelatase subunit ChlD
MNSPARRLGTLLSWARYWLLFLVCLYSGAPVAFAYIAPAPDEAQELLEQIREKGPRVDVEVFGKLGQLKSQAGLDALIEGLALISSDFGAFDDSVPIFDAYRALRHFEGVKPLAPPVVDFLIQEWVDKEFSRALVARGALTPFLSLAEKKLRKALDKNKKQITKAVLLGALLPLLADQGDAKALDYLLEHVQVPYTALGEKLKETFSKFKPDKLGKPMKDALGRSSLDLVVKLALVEGLGPIPGGDIQKGLDVALESKHHELVVAALEATRLRGGVIKPAQLKRLAKSKHPQVRFAAYRALAGDPDSKDHGKWMEYVIRGARSKDADEQGPAFHELTQCGSPFAVEALAGFLKDKQSGRRKAALEGLLLCRSHESLLPLIECFGLESDSGLRKQYYLTLKQLTGLDWGDSSERWQRWWAEEGPAFVLPSAKSARRTQSKRDRSAWEAKERYAMFGLNVESRAAVFIIDASNSMATRMEDRVLRMDQAKRQLAAALKVFPNGARFNIIFFGSQVIPFEQDLVIMTDEVRKRAQACVNDQALLGHTALYDALQLAFTHKQADSFYLLSDGVPSGGTVDDIRAIRKQVRTWNRGRESRVKLHCVSLGSSLTILKQLAKDSKGQYLEILK